MGVAGQLLTGLGLLGAVVATVVPALLFVSGVVSFGTGASMFAKARAAQDRAEMEVLLREFRPAVLSPGAVEPFAALHFVHTASATRYPSVARFTLEGVDPASARSADAALRQVAYDSGKNWHYALTTHEFGLIDPDSGRFKRIEVDPSVGSLDWPKGLAYDSTRKQVVIVTSHVYTRFYRHGPYLGQWERLPSEIRDFPLVALTYSPDEDCLYGLSRRPGDRALREIHRFNPTGAALGSIKLDPPVPLPDDTEAPLQIHFSSGKLMLVLPPLPIEMTRAAGITHPTLGQRILAIDPVHGEVAVAASALPALLVANAEVPVEAENVSDVGGGDRGSVACDRIAPTALASLPVDKFQRALSLDTDPRLFETLDAHPALVCATYHSSREGDLSMLGYVMVHRPNLETSLYEFVHRGASPDSAIAVAARLGQRSRVALLLKLGANPNAGDALIHAAATRNGRVVVDLLEAGADPNRRAARGGRLGDAEPSALHFATFFGDTWLMRALVDAGADVNLRDGFGEPPLVGAVEKQHVGAVLFLIEQGADPYLMHYKHVEQLRELAKRRSLSGVLERLG